LYNTSWHHCVCHNGVQRLGGSAINQNNHKIDNKISSLSQPEQIEYYLGKDRYKNKFFKPHIPYAWEIESCNPEFVPGVLWSTLKNKIIQHEGIEFEFNNLGYRSHYDYTIEDLSTKKNILCIGDSYVCGPTCNYEDLWTSQLQRRLPEYNIVTLGLPGWSFDTIGRVGVSTIQALANKVDFVLVIPPNDHRREFVSKQYKKIISHPQGVTNVPYDEYWDHIDWQSNNYNYFKNSLLLKAMTESYGGTYIELLLRVDGGVNYHDRGPRGLTGPNTYTALANYFYKKIKGLPSKFEELNR